MISIEKLWKLVLDHLCYVAVLALSASFQMFEEGRGRKTREMEREQ